MTISPSNHRILVIDDNPAIQADFVKILCPTGSGDEELEHLEAALFGEEATPTPPEQSLPPWQVDCASQGQEGLEMVKAALLQGEPYALVFSDIRMPPGWDGVETAERLLKVDARLQLVLCTAFSDYRWADLHQRLGVRDNLLILKKPFDPVEVLQLATSLCHKWSVQAALNQKVNTLQDELWGRAAALEATNHELRRQIAERERVEVELRLAQKLEAVGQLAAGVAHEINTPVQFIGDSVCFLRAAFEDLTELLDAWRAHGAEAPSTPELDAIAALEDEIDLPDLETRIPGAFDRTQEGIDRVTRIVRAMKEFAHPDTREMADADLNKALQSALTMTANEYKYVADVEVKLSALPMVRCHLGDLNQAFLNLIVNAAHAIEARGEPNTRGRITVRSQQVGDEVAIAFGDTGCGIPEDIQARIFDPFFTTKEVGKGTGQGLAITHSIIVERHGGRITVDSAVGEGSTFTLWLPVDGQFTEARRATPGRSP